MYSLWALKKQHILISHDEDQLIGLALLSLWEKLQSLLGSMIGLVFFSTAHALTWTSKQTELDLPVGKINLHLGHWKDKELSPTRVERNSDAM